MRRLLRAAVRGATVTHGEALSLRIDPLLLRAANILPLEEVELVNHATGARVTTFAEEAGEGSGEVHAPRMRAGDVVSILSWGLLHDGQTLNHHANLVSVDEKNRLVAMITS
jgi:aspartate 1-decarboxylase